jgi:cytidine deaminase
MSDAEVIEAARSLIAACYVPGRHEVAAALKTRSGKIFAAVHLEASVGRVAVCAEAVAIGMAASAGDTEIEQIVAVDRNGEIIPPCGMCRELISDYAPTAQVVLGGKNGAEFTAIVDLLPRKYRSSDDQW